MGLEQGPEEEQDLKLTLKMGPTAGTRTGPMAITVTVDLRIAALMIRAINQLQVVVGQALAKKTN